jgi:Ala-tRNA(Pro) deacylase
MNPYAEIIQLLTNAGVEFRTFQHEAVRTSEEAAAVRGTPLERGAKALVLECGDGLLLAVISAAAKVDFRALKQRIGVKRVQMASADRVRAVTGCEPGGVPPFGNLFGLRVIVDPSLLDNEWIDFNAGDRTRSVEMRADDFVRLADAEVVAFAAAP